MKMPKVFYLPYIGKYGGGIHPILLTGINDLPERGSLTCSVQDVCYENLFLLGWNECDAS